MIGDERSVFREPSSPANTGQVPRFWQADAASRKHAHADLTAYRELVDAGPTEFTGFDELTCEARILGKLVPVVIR